MPHISKFDHAAYARKWRAANKERSAEINRKCYLKNKSRFRMEKKEKMYGLSSGDYNKMLEAQGGVCAICHKPETATYGGKVKMLAVDHDHATGKVRGLLCQKHNHMIGSAEDNVLVLESAINYLKAI